jgi:hypothetical protein
MMQATDHRFDSEATKSHDEAIVPADSLIEPSISSCGLSHS